MKAARAVIAGPSRPTTLTLVEWPATWLEGNRGQLEPQTWTRYERVARLQLAPVLGRRRLADLVPEDIRRLQTARRHTHLSGTSQRHAPRSQP